VSAHFGYFERFVRVFFVVVEDLDFVEITNHDEPGDIFGFEPTDVVHCLGVGGFEGLAPGFHFDQDLAGEQVVDVVGFAAGEDDLVLGEAGLPVDTEDVEEVLDEFDVILFFGAGAGAPFALEGDGSGFDLVPGEHGVIITYSG